MDAHSHHGEGHNHAPEPPLYAWMVSLNRDPTREEYSKCLQSLDPVSQERVRSIKNREDAWRTLVGHLVPHVIMKQRGIPRNDWSIQTTKFGKPYIECTNQEKQMGYSVSHDGSFVAMAFALGAKSKVRNIGVDVRRIAIPPKVNVSAYVESLSHKLTPLELTFLSPDLQDEVIVRRLFILWTLKESYTKALGQPFGFDFSRIECNIPNEEILVDGVPLQGWEFRLFKANVGVVRKGVLNEEVYQCVCAIYRGGSSCVWAWSEKPKELDKWLRFVTIDNIISAAVSPVSPK